MDRFVALTEFSRQRLVASGLPAERIVVHPNFTADPGPRSSPPGTSRTVVFVGRLSPEKGLSVALRAWRQAAPVGLELVVAGDGPQRAELEGIAGPGVRFLGRLDQVGVRELLLGSRLVLFPSLWYEGQPLGVLESFAAGTAVLGSSIGGLGETIAPLGKDWSAAPGNIDSWSAALKRLGDDELVNRGGDAARRTYESRHSPAVGLRQLLETYDAVCARREPRLANC